nr:MAG TPA: hypothetical protein [Caudoviricetes sp.]
MLFSTCRLEFEFSFFIVLLGDIFFIILLFVVVDEHFYSIPE